uniref:Uncharacterized protein n=1 Tax=Anopheles quadriannulatus TaxID=34691 RepID=A0A182XE83_ANOQN
MPMCPSIRASRSLPPFFGSSIFGGRVEKPLMALSLESSETAPAPASDQLDDDDYDYDDVDDGDDDRREGFFPLTSYQLRQLTSSRRFYDMVLGVLGVMETEARHQVQRARDRKQEIVRSANGGDDRPTSEEQPAIPPAILNAMAKLGLLFIVIFCIVQITLAARLRRDVVEDGVQTLKKTISDTFTKENVDTFFDKLSQFGEMFKEKAGELGDTIKSKGSFAMVRRDAPAAPAEEPNFFQSIMSIKDKIEGVFQETQQNVLKSLGFQSNEEVVQTIQTNTNQYVERLRSVQGVIEEEVKKNSDIFEPILKDLNTKLAQTTATLSEQNPEVVQKAKEYQAQVQSNVQALVAEAQKTVEKLKEDTRVPTENIQDALKKLYDYTFETLTKTANELKPKN